MARHPHFDVQVGPVEVENPDGSVTVQDPHGSTDMTIGPVELEDPAHEPKYEPPAADAPGGPIPMAHYDGGVPAQAPYQSPELRDVPPEDASGWKSWKEAMDAYSRGR